MLDIIEPSGHQVVKTPHIISSIGLKQKFHYEKNIFSRNLNKG
jgi:hypothetical protein